MPHIDCENRARIQGRNLLPKARMAIAKCGAFVALGGLLLQAREAQSHPSLRSVEPPKQISGHVLMHPSPENVRPLDDFQEYSPAYALAALGVDRAHVLGIRGQDVRVAILGTGVDFDTQLRQLRLALEDGECIGLNISDTIRSGCVDERGNTVERYKGPRAGDAIPGQDHEHELAQAVIAIADRAKLYPIVTNSYQIDADGQKHQLVFLDSIVQGINAAIEADANVVVVAYTTGDKNLSDEKTLSLSPSFTDAVKRAHDAGIIVVFPGGNDSTGKLWPVGHPNIQTATTISEDGFIPPYAPDDLCITFAVRSEGIPVQEAETGRWGLMYGTSMSTGVLGALDALSQSTPSGKRKSPDGVIAMFARGQGVTKEMGTSSIPEADAGDFLQDEEFRRQMGISVLSLPIVQK